ncbi:MAG TPA: hypothetical protein DCG20_02725 [Prevotella sp.]|nr:hypothetical protein [Prevotella sp.]
MAVVTMAVCSVSAFAQNTLVATLTHGDEIRMFYGTNALQQACSAATHGDVINLSGGNFQSTKITKAVAVRGTGIHDANPTYIVNDFDVEIPANVTEKLSFEGCRITNTMTIKGTLSNAYFLKNSLAGVSVFSSNGKMDNGMFVNCDVYGMSLYGQSTAQIINSYVEHFSNSGKLASFVNCVINTNGYAHLYKCCQFVNCIMYGMSGGYFPSTCSAMNCVDVSGYKNALNNISLKENCSYAGMDIFQESNVWNDLTDEAKAKYLGIDGTPVGKFGGMIPYNMTPSYPQITKMNVAAKTTADGKLSVEIGVSAAQ